MCLKHMEPPGAEVVSEELTVPKAKELVRLLMAEKIPYASLLQCRKDNDKDVVVLELEVELPQKRVNPIERRERVAVVFDPSDQHIPEVLALREDFPLVPHLNLRAQELPRSLCLYDEPYDVIKLRWAAMPFVERIRTWLARAAKGMLHEPDQSLEPLLMGHTAPIVLPSDLIEKSQGNGASKLHIIVRGTENRPFYLAKWFSDTSDGEGLPIVGTVVLCKPMQHGVIRRSPASLAELHDFLEQGDTDLLGTLRSTFRRWYEQKELRSAWFILILLIPKYRHQGAEPESIERWAFATTKSIMDVGCDIGVWTIENKEAAFLLQHDMSKTGSAVPIEPLNPVCALSRDRAAALNGCSKAVATKIVAIGLGALGSQVFMNLVRAGFGEWVLVDDDWLLPHNMARHALDGHAVGMAKASILAAMANKTIDGDAIAEDIVADVIRPGEQQERLVAALQGAGLILDMSASVPVARYLALDVVTDAPRVSVFTNPSGKDLVLLAEGTRREVKLDMLEMQLYRAVANTDDLAGHLDATERIRYGRSCRDVSSTMPQDYLALHAAIASRALKSLLDKEEPSILVWRLDEDTLSVRRVTVSTSEVIEMQFGDWRLQTDKSLLAKLADLRAGKLPNETGGVLLGSFDLYRRIVYVVDALPSPPDSEEWPTLYIRGCRGLQQRVDEVTQQTGGMLEYVGEWHSHPEGGGIVPSNDDMKVFSWLTNLMDADGLPALMMIPGTGESCGTYLCKMVRGG